MNDCLDKLVREDTLFGQNQYFCDICKGKVNAFKMISIETFPRVLIIDFVRYNLGRKNNEIINYPKTLDLAKYTSQEIDKINMSRVLCLTEEQSVYCNDISPVYDLYGVIVHKGFSRSSGHYYSYCRGFESGDQWYLMNDSIVSPLSGVDEALGKQAYILFYIARTNITSIN